MITFKDTYKQRKKEIEEVIELMKFLEAKQNLKEDGKSGFDRFFYEGDEKIGLTYQGLINILKSNVSLMLYNIIEYTVTNLVDSIYDEIRMNNLSYMDVNHYIKEIWRKTALRSANDPNANFNTFLKKNEQIIDEIINQNVLDIRARNALPAGNLDGKTIRSAFEQHGIPLETGSPNYRPDILDSIKEQRNNLAHGEVSFVDALKDDSISDIEKSKRYVVSFLEEVIENVSGYIDNETYRISV